MRPGRKRTGADAPAKTPARGKGSATRTKSKRPPPIGPGRRKPAKGLLAAIMADPRMTTTDKRRIREASEQGLTVGEVAALSVYELRLAQRLHEAGELSAKDFVIAVNKSATHAAAAVQLAAGEGEGGGAHVTVVFAGQGPTSTRPEAINVTPPDPVVGDLIEAE